MLDPEWSSFIFFCHSCLLWYACVLLFTEGSHLCRHSICVIWEIRLLNICPSSTSPEIMSCGGAFVNWIFPSVFLFLGNWLVENVQISLNHLFPFLLFLPLSAFHFHISKGCNWVNYGVINHPVNFYAFCCVWAALVPLWQLLGSAHCNYQLKTKMLLGPENLMAETELVFRLQLYKVLFVCCLAVFSLLVLRLWQLIRMLDPVGSCHYPKGV